MIECPWCTKEVVITDHICPECKHEVLVDHMNNVIFENIEENEEYTHENVYNEESVEEAIMQRFKCIKCGHDQCVVKEVAMTGTGLSKILDIQYNHYLFVSCQYCGYVEVYNPDILRSEKSGSLGSIMDVIFGR